MFSWVDGRYHYSEAGRVVYSAHEVAFLLDTRSGAVLQHGERLVLEHALERSQAALREEGEDDAADALVLVDSVHGLDQMQACVSQAGVLSGVHAQREAMAAEEVKAWLEAIGARAAAETAGRIDARRPAARTASRRAPRR